MFSNNPLYKYSFVVLVCVLCFAWQVVPLSAQEESDRSSEISYADKPMEIPGVQFYHYDSNKDQTVSAHLDNWAENTIKNLNVSYDVTNRVEAIYDGDQNQKLENVEVLVFLKEVLYATEKKGKFRVISEILQEYDVNQDGFISREESEKIEEYLYEN